jgi:hypothetical protein
MKKYKILLFVSATFCLLVTGMFTFLLLTHYPATVAAFGSITEDQSVIVEKDRIEFWPRQQEPEIGLIIYPGGNVDFHSYAPLAADISKNGYYTVVVKMPLSLAVFNKSRADEIISQYPQIKHWAIAGHSLGGVMAARYALDNEEIIKGLLLWASYPDKDISLTDITVLSLVGTNDGILNLERYETSKPYLPDNTVFMPIVGGNHSYFGSYGFQRGDLEADITQEDQQRQIVDATVLFLRNLHFVLDGDS